MRIPTSHFSKKPRANTQPCSEFAVENNKADVAAGLVITSVFVFSSSSAIAAFRVAHATRHIVLDALQAAAKAFRHLMASAP